MEKKELKFYKSLLGFIDTEIDFLKTNPNKFKDINYFISRQTYYNIKNICEGKGEKKYLKRETLENICDHFGYTLKDVDYIIEKKKNT